MRHTDCLGVAGEDKNADHELWKPSAYLLSVRATHFEAPQDPVPPVLDLV